MSMAFMGKGFAQALLGFSPGVEREKWILSVFRSQGLVSYGGGGLFSKITTSEMIDGKLQTLELSVSPFVASIGTDEDPFPFPAWPWTYQTIADSIDCLLPTRKICLLVAKQAKVSIDPHPFPTKNPSGVDDGGKYNESSARFVESYESISHDLSVAQSIGEYAPGQLVSGMKKDVVVGPALDGSRVAIFGWFRAKPPVADDKSSRWQPYSTIHESTYADYSHSWRVVRRQGKLNGKNVNLDEICNDPKFHVLVSDQGPFPMRFPSAKAKSSSTAAKVSTAAGFVGGAALGAVAGGIVGGPVGAVLGGVAGAARGRRAGRNKEPLP
jgi:hypothetical protein